MLSSMKSTATMNSLSVLNRNLPDIEMDDKVGGQSLVHKSVLKGRAEPRQESTMKVPNPALRNVGCQSAQQFSSISRSDSSDSFDSFVSSLSGDDTRVDDVLHGAELLDGGRKSHQKVENDHFEMCSPSLFRERPIAPICSSSTTSSRDSNEMFPIQKSHRNSLPAVQANRPSKNIDALHRLSLSLKPMKSYIRKSQNILPPLSLGTRSSSDKRHSDNNSQRPGALLRDVSESSMDITPPTFMSPVSVVSSPHLVSGRRESLSRPRPLHRRNTSNASTVFSGSEVAAFPIVGYLSDENSRAILHQGSEDNSVHQSSEDGRKKSWAAKEMKHLKKKFTSKRLGGDINKNVELCRSKGYLM